AFPDASEVRDHAFAAEKGCAGLIVYLQLPIINEPSTANDFIVVRNRAVLVLIIEFPKAGHHAECHVEFSAGPVADLPRSPQYLAKLGTDRHRMLARGRIQSLNVATVAPVAE